MVNDVDEKPDRFAQKAREALQGGEYLLDEETLSRLAQARKRAMLEMPHGNRRSWPVVAAIAASLLVALIWSRWPQPNVPDVELLESMDLLLWSTMPGR